MYKNKHKVVLEFTQSCSLNKTDHSSTVALEVARPNIARRAVFAIEQYSNGPILRSSNDPIPLSNNGRFLRSNNGELLGSNNGQLLGSNNGLFLEPNNGLFLRSYSGPFLRPNVLWYIYNVHDVIYIQ